MNNVFVYCALDGATPLPITQELLSEGRRLATALGVQLEAIAVGGNLKNKVEDKLLPYGVDCLYIAEKQSLCEYMTAPYAQVVGDVLKVSQPQIALFPATFEGCDLAPRLAARLHTGLTAHCTQFQLADYTDPATNETYRNLLHQVRPALGGNIEATILTPYTKPQMATVIQGSFSATIVDEKYKGEVIYLNNDANAQAQQCWINELPTENLSKAVDLQTAKVVVCGGYGVGSKRNFALLQELAQALGGEVAATRAAVDAGWADLGVQIGQTGQTISPKLFIACGCSGALQFTSGMKNSATIVSINTDPEAPMNALADYVVVGRVEDVLPKMIKQLKEKH